MSANHNPNRIDPTPVRLSTNVTIDRQTPKADFGDRVKLGLDAATDAVANGAAVAAPFVPGGAIVSAAVSSVTAMSSGTSSGQSLGTQYSAGLAPYSYAMGGITTVGGGDSGSGINTTVGSTSNTAGGGSVLGGSTTSSTGGSNILGTGSTANESKYSGEMERYVQANDQLLKVQMTMQRETQVFQTISNVLKVRHETIKNTIGNVR